MNGKSKNKSRNNRGCNSPEEFEKLTEDEKKILIDWINTRFIPISKFTTFWTSYGLKHIFSSSENGFYITNGAFKGAMLKCGFKVYNKNALNWEFNISKNSPVFKKKK